MVTQVQSWQAADGKLFTNEREALEHDAVIRLSEMKIFNHASAMAIVEQANEVLDALQPLVDWTRRNVTHDEVAR